MIIRVEDIVIKKEERKKRSKPDLGSVKLNVLDLINGYNARIDPLQPIKYDGLRCPKCYEATVTSEGYTWCPSFNCDFGQAPKMLLLNKWK